MNVVSLSRAAALASVVVVLGLAKNAPAAWSTDSSCSAENAPGLPGDYVDWWQGCASTPSTSGWPNRSGSAPSCVPRQWSDAQGRCVRLSCAREAAVLTSCGASASGTPRLDGVRLTPDGCAAQVTTARGVSVEPVSASHLACSRLIGSLGRTLPTADVGAVPRGFWTP